MNSNFDARISRTPIEWVTPLAEVVDTADSIRLALKDWGLEPDDAPELLLELTKLVLQRHDANA